MSIKISLLLFILLNLSSFAIAQRYYNIVDYGAVNDTSKLITNAINKAITKCYSKGGGRVVGYGFFIRHVKNISLSAITLSSVNEEQRIPLLGVDVDKISIHNFNAGLVSDKLKFRFSDVKNYNIDEMNKVEILK
jgi:pectate lyase